MDHHRVEMCTVVKQSGILDLFLDEMDAVCIGPRQKGPSRLLSATSPKAKVYHCMGLCCDASINAEKYTELLEQHMLPSR